MVSRACDYKTRFKIRQSNIALKKRLTRTKGVILFLTVNVFVNLRRAPSAPLVWTDREPDHGECVYHYVSMCLGGETSETVFGIVVSKSSRQSVYLKLHEICLCMRVKLRCHVAKYPSVSRKTRET